MGDLKARIVQDQDIMAGKPVVKGTRIPVEAVLAFLAETPNVEESLEAYSRLTGDDVGACLAFAEERVRSTKRLVKSRI